MRGLTPPLALKMQYLFYEKTVIALLLKTLGLERGNFFPTAGAAIPPVIEEFVRSAGILMITGYGLTESTATVSCDRWNQPITLGSIGRPLDGVQVKFGEHDEIRIQRRECRLPRQLSGCSDRSFFADVRERHGEQRRGDLRVALRGEDDPPNRRALRDV